MPKRPKLDPTSISERIQTLSREPFRDILSRFLECAPDDEDIKAAAKKSPDRWAQATAILGRLSGFHDRHTIEHEHNLIVKIQNMSDAEVELELKKLTRELNLKANAIEAELVEAETSAPERPGKK